MGSKTFFMGAVIADSPVNDEQFAALWEILNKAPNWTDSQKDRLFWDVLSALWLAKPGTKSPSPDELVKGWRKVAKACDEMRKALDAVPYLAWERADSRAMLANDELGPVETPKWLADVLRTRATQLETAIADELKSLPKPDRSTKPQKNAARFFADVAVKAYKDACGKWPTKERTDRATSRSSTAWFFNFVSSAAKFAGLTVGKDVFLEAVAKAKCTD